MDYEVKHQTLNNRKKSWDLYGVTNFIHHLLRTIIYKYAPDKNGHQSKRK